jgi:hypothetical protein
MPTSWPISAVRSIANAPPTVTRSAARPAGAPPSRAPTAPNSASSTSAASAVTGTRTPIGAATIRASGSTAPTAKLTADTTAACNGRANPPGCKPSSSRRWLPSGSTAVSRSATVVASARHDDLEAGRHVRRYTITDDGRAALAEARRALRELADELL